MGGGGRLIGGMVAAALMVPAAMILSSVPGYVPSTRLRRIAAEASGSDPGRQAMVDALAGTRAGRRGRAYRHVDATMLGTDVRRLRSWENDAGLLAVTDIECPAARPCTVTASALLPYR